MSPEERNVATLKNAYAQWGEAKISAKAATDAVGHWVALFDANASFQTMGSRLGFYEGTGPKAALQYFQRISDGWEMVDYVVDEYIASDDRVIVLCECKWRSKKTGKIAESRKADSWRFDADGRVVQFYEYFDTAAAIAADTP